MRFVTVRMGLLWVLGSMIVGGSAQAAELCPPDLPLPQVEVHIREKPLSMDTSLTRAALKNVAREQAGLVFAQGAEEDDNFVGGMMRGKWAVDHKQSFKTATNKKTRQACVWMEELDVWLVMEPHIYLASDLPPHGCLYREIYTHEIRHVEVDRELARKYKEQFMRGMDMVFQMDGAPMSRVVKISDVAREKERISAAMKEPLLVLFEKMMRERAQLQAAVDSPAEYKAVTWNCRHEMVF